MDYNLILQFLISKLPILASVFAVVGSAITVVRAKVKATESNEDDTALANLEAKPLVGAVLKALEVFSLIKVKE